MNLMNTEELNNAIFEFLKENLYLDEEGTYSGDKYVRLKLKNPETNEVSILGWQYITIKEGENYW